MPGMFKTTTTVWELDGKRVKAKTPGAQCRRIKSKKWYDHYYDRDGIRHKVALSTDKAASRTLLAELQLAGEGRAEEKRIEESLEDWKSHLRDKGNTAKYVSQQAKRAREVISETWPSELSAPRLHRAIAAIPLGANTKNKYLQSVKQFARFLGPRVDQAIQYLASFRPEQKKLRLDTSPEEASQLLAATAKSKRSFRHLTGKDRRLLYWTALATGLRARELAQLTESSLSASSITVDSAYTKNRRTATIPIPNDLANALEVYVKKMSPASRIWPHSWWHNSAKMLDLDLKEAGLSLEDERGCRRDFHSLRTTFITWLASDERNAPRVVQEMARHGSMSLTMDVYAKVRMQPKIDASATLPKIVKEKK